MTSIETSSGIRRSAVLLLALDEDSAAAPAAEAEV